MLEIKNLWKEYDGEALLKGVSFSVGAGETVSLLGPSGSGKSTILRIIAGLESADRGEVVWDGQKMEPIPAHQRGFGLMFQDYALFPHRNVAENIAFGLRMQGLPRPEIEARVAQALRQVNLEGFNRRSVTDLSGGEQQRVALARALAPQPRLMMLDEPLAALDRSLREQLVTELRTILHQTKIPAIYVTHDQQEAFTVADRLILLHEGEIVQVGSPAQIFDHPQSEWVARFFGMDNLIRGRVFQNDPLEIQTDLGIFRSVGQKGVAIGERVTLLVRPTAARVDTNTAGSYNFIKGVVEDTIFRGERYQINLRMQNGQEFHFYLDHKLPIAQQVSLAISPEGVVCLTPEGGKAFEPGWVD